MVNHYKLGFNFDDTLFKRKIFSQELKETKIEFIDTSAKCIFSEIPKVTDEVYFC